MLFVDVVVDEDNVAVSALDYCGVPVVVHVVVVCV